MQRLTLDQRWELNQARTTARKTALWISYGLTPEEARATVTGGSYRDAEARQGGVWTVGYVEYPQAISAEHALKLYQASGGDPAGEEVRLIQYRDGVRWDVTAEVIK